MQSRLNSPIRLLLCVIASLCLAVGSTFADVSISASAPSTDIIASSPAGTTDTSVFDEAANSNHARGQLFTLPDGAGSSFDITAITIRKNQDQTFSNDSLTLTVFEGTQAQWDSGTGHSTADDGNDYFVDTTVTPLYTEAFTLDGLITNGDYITFELATPLTVNESSDLGFLMVYDQAAGPDRLRHREAGAGGGRISITTTNHGTSGTRRMLHFIHGTPSGAGSATLTFAGPFQDGMVLQRDKPIKIWGQSDPAETVNVSVDGEIASATADASGRWEATLPALSAGGPHQLTASAGATTRTLNDVLIGDLWLAFGQSNMFRPLGEMTGRDFYLDEIQDNGAPVRCLRITQFGALTPQDEAQVPAGHYVSGGMNWLPASTANTWTSVGTVFAYRMYEATGVPTAIVWAAWGSSSIEGWMPAEMAGEFPHFADLLTDYYRVDRPGVLETYASGNGFATNTAALTSLFTNGWTGATSQHDIFVRTRSNVIYNQMIHPITDLGISGFVWYQGEANTTDPAHAIRYGFTFPAFIETYRERFGQGDLPFLSVQLPSFNDAEWPWFRESQSKATELDEVYAAITIDTGLANNIHPLDKEPIGIRLSLLAREHLYGENIESSGPVFDSMTVTGGTVRVSFTHAAGLTTDDGTAPDCFEIAGSDQVFHDATAVINGGDVLLTAGAVPNPIAVRYAWKPAPVNDLNLVNSAGLPTAPFRTDTFPIPGLGAQVPEGGNDSYATPNNVTLNVSVAGVLTNDFDLNGDALTAQLVDDVSEGALTLSADGSLSYVPSGTFIGTDSFTYRANGGGVQSGLVTVEIEVGAPLDFYAQWQPTIPWAGGDDITRTGDPDGDGLPNLIEFALGLDPLVSGDSGISLSTTGAGFEFDFNNPQPGVVYEVQLSNDLEQWNAPPFAQLTSVDTTPVTIPAAVFNGQRMFVRLRISE